MVDVTDYVVGSGETHTHIAKIDGEIHHIAIDSNDNLVQVLASATDNEYEVHELIGDVCIPYVLFSGPPAVGAQCMQAIMKRLYNHCSPVAVLHNPECEDSSNTVLENDMRDLSIGSSSTQVPNVRIVKAVSSSSDQYVICTPYTRVNKDMLKEVMETFQILCKYRGIEYQPKTLRYMPLTWNVSTYKEGSEIDVAIAFDEEPSLVLSTRLTEEPVAAKVKMNAAQSKKAALIDSILMYSREEIKGDKAKAIELISLISKDRSRDMSFFLAMGRCLYRIFGGDEDGLELWREASVREMQTLCDEYWATLDTTCTYYRIHTLQYWASKDSPKEYAEWNSTSVRAALEASVMATGGILDVANVAYRKNPTLFICDGDEPKEATFFKFNGTYYKPCGVFTLQDYLDREIIPEYEDFLKDLSKLSEANTTGQGGDTSFKEMMQKKIDKCIQIIVKLKSDAFQTSVVKCLMRLFNKPGFDNIRDSNPNLTAFEDCVFDAERKCIRDGIPEDNLTCSTGYEFRDTWNEYNNYMNEKGDINGWDHPDVKIVLENQMKIVYDASKLEILRRENASLLHASNPLKRGLTVHGPTNNGKSVEYSWIGRALGPTYCPDVPNNLFYSIDTHPGGATPHFEMARFARLIIQSEVDDSMTLNEALFKRWTGGTDKVTYRGLYKPKIKSFVPTSKPTTVCNTLAKINGNSAALRTRMLVLKLDSKFITEKDPEYDQVKGMSPEDRNTYMRDNHWYWADLDFDNIIRKTYKAFMWIMIQDYIKYSGGANTVGGHTLVPAKILPKCIIEDTIQYFIKSNIFLQFMRAATRKQGDSPGITTFTLYNAYKKWFQDCVSKFGYVNLGKFLDELASMGYKHNNDIYQGLVLTYQ